MTSSQTLGPLGVALFAAAAAAAQTGPAASPTRLPPAVMAMACAPSVAVGRPDPPLRVTGGQDASARQQYRPGDLITINAGSDHGIEVGAEYYTRRVVHPRGRTASADSPGTTDTSGWIRIYAVDDEMSLATITHACDAVAVGDFLEPFALPTPPVVSSEKPKPERDNYGRVLSGGSRQLLFGEGDFFVLDRGADYGIQAGAQFVIYRNQQVDGNFLFDLGEAVAVSVGPDTSTLLVTLSRAAIETGDLVAMRK